MELPTAESLPSERDALIRLVRGVVLAQGNAFIKELLRSRGVKIGTTKADFQENMVQAIERGELQRQHVDYWLNEVEGWGNQHVYLLKLSKSIRNDPAWRDPRRIEKKVLGAGFTKQWNAHASLEYPPVHTLTGIYFEDGVLRFVWHKGLEFWLRDKTKDYREEIDADTYEFRASRLRGERAVTRFEIRPFDGLAAIFVQIAVDDEEHKTVVQDVKSTVDRVWPFDELEPFAVASVIKRLDTRSLAQGEISAHSTRLNSAGAYVEFGATSAQSGYQDFTPVREVRRAVRPASFTGTTGTFRVPTIDTDGKTRQVRIQLYGEQRRIKLASQMTATEVWSVLHLIRENV